MRLSTRIAIAAASALAALAEDETVPAEPFRVGRELRQLMAQCEGVASREYFIRVPAGRLEPEATRRIRFALPDAGGGQVPCGALVHGLAFQSFDPIQQRWDAAEAADLALAIEVPGSEGPATYRLDIPFARWRLPAFALPVGPGDDVAVGRWHLVLHNRSGRPIRQSTAWMRLLLRLD